MLDLSLQQLWLNAIALIPVAFVAAVICRWLPCKPSTRHALWLAVLSMLIVPSLLLTVVPEDILRNPITSIKAVITDDTKTPEISTIEEAKPAKSQVNPPVSKSSLQFQDQIKKRSNSKPKQSKVDVNTLLTYPYIKDTKRTNTKRAETNRQFLTPPTYTLTKPETKKDNLSTSTSAITSTTNSKTETKEPVKELQKSPASTEESQTATTLLTEFQSWAVSLLKVRDIATAIPPLPTAIWLGGLILVLWFLLLRISRVRRMIHTGKPAHESVNRLVRNCADRLNLSKVPVAVMVTEAVSPMLWCGKKKTLIIPEALWKNLDNPSRMSVIIHELAHMKRRDHWVCWLELVISAVYWWNPIVWWIRKHIRDEADYACDAWVTQLMPRSRRVYAQALLESRKYTNTETLAGPVVGLGANGSHAKRFARRLTMVMTDQQSHGSTPRLTRRGTALVLSLTIIGCLVAPIAACPPESKPEKQKNYEVVVTDKAPTTQPFRKKKQVETAPEASTTDSTFEKFMHDRNAGEEDAAPEVATYTTRPSSPFLAYTNLKNDDETDSRLENLEARLESLLQILQHLDLEGIDELEFQQDAQTQAQDAYQRAMDAYEVLATDEVNPFENAIREYSNLESQQSWVAVGDNTTSRIYHISEGKLKEIIELMVREDVPILVTPMPEDGAIKVHATPHHHHIFEAFIRMIDPDGKEGHTTSWSVPTSAIVPVEIANILYEQDAEQLRLQQLNFMIQNLETQQQQHDLHSDSLEHQADIMEDQIDSIIDHLEDLEADDEDLSREELQVRRHQVKALRSQIKSMERVLRDCEGQVEEACDRADDCCDEIEELMEEIEEIQSEEDEDDDCND